ncbi:MAG: cytochrome c [Terriglobales bacterium]|jgi:mono/diheme cytochrome c family protein
MKRIDVRLLTIATAFAVVLSLPLSVHAQDASALFKSKCAACHGADGTGSAMGKKLGVLDLHGAEVQKMSDAELANVVTNGRDKMPAFGKSLKADDIQGLVAYIRTLKK